MLQKTDLIYTGKAKEMYNTTDPTVVWAHYMDQATALNGKKKVQVAHKGTLNNQISSIIFQYLQQQGINSAFIKKVSSVDELLKKLKMIPLEVVLRNYASGHFESKFNVKHLLKFKQPIVEFYYKSDELDDPFMNDAQILALGIATEAEIATLKADALKVNDQLIKFFDAINITLVDFKLEFGKDSEGKILLGDEISPDNMRLIDKDTKQSLDKDVFRKNTGDLATVYTEVLDRIERHYQDVVASVD